MDSYDFRTLQNRTVDVKTGFSSFHTRLLVNTEQFDGTPKDYYVAVKFETQATGATEMEETKTAGKTETIGASETEEAGGKTE